MARTTHRLTALKAAAAKAKGLHHDGGGLYLRVTATGSKSWMLRYTLNGLTRDMGLGPYPKVSLAGARQQAVAQRDLVGRRIDPLNSRKAAIAADRLSALGIVTFRECAEVLLKSNESAWRNPKHRQQWRNTLTAYAYPVIGDVAIGAIDTTHVLKILEPIWQTVPETASRLRGRIERVLDAAKARGLRTGENPCRWRGHLDALLPPRRKVRAVVHHPALPYAELPSFMRALQSRSGLSARALEFTILTAARTNEALGARWPEFDLQERLWTVPACRMKGEREHRVPLSPRAVRIMRDLEDIQTSEFVFPGIKSGRPLSDMALLMLLRDIRPGITTHGFRSTFKDWCAECTSTPNFVSEAALAPALPDAVEAAYRRGDLLQKRRKLMEAWESFCSHRKRRIGDLRSGHSWSSSNAS